MGLGKYQDFHNQLTKLLKHVISDRRCARVAAPHCFIQMFLCSTHTTRLSLETEQLIAAPVTGLRSQINDGQTPINHHTLN